MRKWPPHQVGPVKCGACLARLAECHPDLSEWFWFMKAVKPFLHVSWGYRNKEEQGLAIASGRSEKPFPMSKHNATNDIGEPESLAVDVFEQIAGRGVWEPKTMYDIWVLTQKTYPDRFKWGGKFKSLGDFCHFELVE